MATVGVEPEADTGVEGEGIDRSDVTSSFDAEFADIDAVLARSGAAIAEAVARGRSSSREPHPWPTTVIGTRKSGLRNGAPCSGRPKTSRRCCKQLPPSIPGMSWLSTARALARPTAGVFDRPRSRRHRRRLSAALKSRPQNRARRSPPASGSRDLAIAQGLIAATEVGLKERDRLMLARQMMEREL